MEGVIARGAGLDVQQKSVLACVRVPTPAGGRRSGGRLSCASNRSPFWRSSSVSAEAWNARER